MSRAKSVFKFTVHANPAVINDVIQRYLAANQFSPKPTENANYYYFNDPMLKGKRSFEYYISGNDVTIYAYLGTYKKPRELEGFVAALPKQSYKNDLAPLFEELKRLDGGQFNQSNMGQPNMDQPNMAQGYGYAPQPNTSVDTFVQQNMQKQETWTIVGFVVSLVGLVLSFFGVYYGVILYFLEFYCAIQGIHSRRKGLAIATIVLASVSIVILIIMIALTYAWRIGY